MLAPGGAHDDYGAPCPVVCSSLVDKGKGAYTCGAVELGADGAIRVRFVDESGASTDGGSLPPA